jgi:MFS family permease
MDNTDQISTEEKSFKTIVLVVASFVTFITAFMASSSILALPSIGREFNADAVQLGWVMSCYLLSSAVFLLPFGRLGDIIGQKKIFLWGIFLYTISTFLIIFSWNVTLLIIFRIMQGFAGAMIFGTSMAIIAAVFRPGERGRAMGINITATYLG